MSLKGKGHIWVRTLLACFCARAKARWKRAYPGIFGGVTIEFRVEHVPLADNYAHSEVRAFKDGRYDPKLKIPQSVKKEFRYLLSEKTRIIRYPEV
jgi:hypothetical protein